MTTTAPVSENQTFTITEEISRARLARADVRSRWSRRWDGSTKRPTAAPLPMILEPHPGGRWYRDLGGDNGHLWGFVQSIKRPDAARDLGTAVHVDGGHLEPALPADARRPTARSSSSRTRWSDRSPKIIGRGSRRDGRRCTRASARPPKPRAK